MVVAAAYVGGDGHVCRAVDQRQVVYAQVLLRLRFGRGTRGANGCLEALVHQRAPGAVIKLQVAAAGGVEIADNGAVRGADVLKQLILIGVDATRALGGGGVAIELQQQLGGRGDGLLGDVAGLLKRLHKGEVVDKGMVLSRDLAGEDGGAMRGLLAHKEIAMV